MLQERKIQGPSPAMTRVLDFIALPQYSRRWPDLQHSDVMELIEHKSAAEDIFMRSFAQLSEPHLSLRANTDLVLLTRAHRTFVDLEALSAPDTSPLPQELVGTVTSNMDVLVEICNKQPLIARKRAHSLYAAFLESSNKDIRESALNWLKHLSFGAQIGVLGEHAQHLENASRLAPETKENLYTQGQASPKDLAMIINTMDVTMEDDLKNQMNQWMAGIVYYLKEGYDASTLESSLNHLDKSRFNTSDLRQVTQNMLKELLQKVKGKKLLTHTLLTNYLSFYEGTNIIERTQFKVGDYANPNMDSLALMLEKRLRRYRR